jgi:CMP-N-acetylneuraminic acid synthetase
MIAIVPMKAHSERVPDKNIRDFNGKPLFCWILDSLLTSKTVSFVVVNTDSLMIGDMVRERYPDVCVLYRPDYLRGDEITANALIRWTILNLIGHHFLYTHSTNPLLKPETIDAAVNFYLDNLKKYDSLLGVTKHQFRLYREDGTPVNHNPKNLIRSQDLSPIYEDNSNLYIFSRESFYVNGRIGQNPKRFEIPKTESIDIDTGDDWQIAEAVAKCRDGWK